MRGGLSPRLTNKTFGETNVQQIGYAEWVLGGLAARELAGLGGLLERDVAKDNAFDHKISSSNVHQRAPAVRKRIFAESHNEIPMPCRARMEMVGRPSQGRAHRFFLVRHAGIDGRNKDGLNHGYSISIGIPLHANWKLEDKTRRYFRIVPQE